MKPAPVGIEHNATSNVGARAGSSASLPGEGRVVLSGVGADLLSLSNSKVGECEKSSGGEHRD